MTSSVLHFNTKKKKMEWGKKRKLKPLKKNEWDRKRKLPLLCCTKKKPTARAGVWRMPAPWLFRRDRTSPWWFWEVCDFDVTGSCDVISPDHFVRGFYNSSFRRCRLKFLVLQKDYKILVHNLSVYEKLEQSTHRIIQKSGAKILLLVEIAL